MNHQWSEEQLKAIHTTNTNILVSASAGAGKTTVLVSRLLKRILNDHISIDHILAMTFTDASAAEMKKRLLIELNNEAMRDDLNKSQKAYRNEQLILLQTASISTIHSFCLTIIKNYYYVIGLDPARINTIFDDSTVSLYKKQAMDSVFNQAYQQASSDFYQALQYFSPRSEDSEELMKTIYKIAKCANTQFNPQVWLEQCKQNEPISTLSKLPSLIKTSFFEKLRVDSEDYLQQLENLLNYVLGNIPTETKIIAQLELKKAKGSLLTESLKNEDYREYRRIFFNSASSVISTYKNDDVYKALRANLNSLSKGLCSSYFEEETYLKDLQLCTPIINLCCGLAMNYLETYNELKKSQGGMDFDDMEHFAYQILLAQDGKIANLYKIHFDEIMVDEFQDTNIIQNAIVDCISRGNNVFRVGDIKQSIYKFRGAQPKIMQSIMQQQTQNNLILYLSNNFRSSKRIVDFNNTLFDALMNVSGLSSQYLQSDYVQIGLPKQALDNPFVEFHLLQMSDFPQNDETIDESLQGQATKANYIAQQILLMKKTSSFTHWNDYVVLVRSHQVKIELKKALDEAHIPYFIDTKSGFYQSDAVSISLSFLKFLFNPTDTLSLVSILLSPYFNYSDEKIAQFKLTCLKNVSFNALEAFDKKTYDELFNLIQTCEHKNIVECLTILYAFHDYYELKLNHQQRTNCDLLFQKACEHSKKENAGIYTFIDELISIEDEKTSEAIPVGDEDDVVKVMTIHQSKGLQFPVVFFWSTSRQDMIENRDLCLVDPLLGMGLHAIELPQRFKRPSIHRIAIEHKLIQEELEEQIRVLYVALTRAQNRLVLVDSVKHELITQPLSRSLIFQRKGLTTLILSAFQGKTNDFFKLIKIDSNWKIDFNEEEVDEINILPRYRKAPQSAASMHTPSSTEAFYIDDLHLSTDPAPADRGTLIHATLEHLPIDTWTYELIHQLQPTLQSSDVEALLRYNQSPLFNEIRTLNVEKEVSFIVKYNQQYIHGVMDLVGHDEKHVILIDYKSDLNVSKKQLSERYTPQIETYYHALTLIHPDKSIQAYIYSTFLNEAILIKQSN